MKRLSLLQFVGPGALLLGAVSLVFGCATSGREGDLSSTAPPDGGGGVFAPNEGGGPPPGTPQGVVYAHSATKLFTIDTGSKRIREIGAFAGCTHVADIALDQDSNMYASTSSELWLIENNTARCTRIAQGTFPNSLSFVPAGTLEPTKETLVGFQGGDYVKINPATGEVTKLGSIGDGLASSGDVVSVKDGKTFVTVTGPGCSDADCLAEIDPLTGKLLKNWGSIGATKAFGLAYWAGDIFAFTEAGEVLVLTLAGDKVEAAALEAPSLSFAGAGSTTIAPVGPVK